jgi:hypothetical protein
MEEAVQAALYDLYHKLEIKKEGPVELIPVG